MHNWFYSWHDNKNIFTLIDHCLVAKAGTPLAVLPRVKESLLQQSLASTYTVNRKNGEIEYKTLQNAFSTVLSGVGATDGWRVRTIWIANTKCIGQTLAKLCYWDTSCFDSDITAILPPFGNAHYVGAWTRDGEGVEIQAKLT